MKESNVQHLAGLLTMVIAIVVCQSSTLAQGKFTGLVEKKEKPALVSSVVIKPGDMTLHRLAKVFKQALMKAEIDGDKVKVITDEGYKVLLKLDPKRQIISFVMLFGFKDSSAKSDRLELANTLNDRVIFARFCLTKEKILWADYHLTYEDGIVAQTIVRSFKWFTMTVTGGIREYDKKDIVE